MIRKYWQGYDHLSVGWRLLANLFQLLQLFDLIVSDFVEPLDLSLLNITKFGARLVLATHLSISWTWAPSPCLHSVSAIFAWRDVSCWSSTVPYKRHRPNWGALYKEKSLELYGTACPFVYTKSQIHSLASSANRLSGRKWETAWYWIDRPSVHPGLHLHQSREKPQPWLFHNSQSPAPGPICFFPGSVEVSCLFWGSGPTTMCLKQFSSSGTPMG